MLIDRIALTFQQYHDTLLLESRGHMNRIPYILEQKITKILHNYVDRENRSGCSIIFPSAKIESLDHAIKLIEEYKEISNRNNFHRDDTTINYCVIETTERVLGTFT